MPRLPPVTSTDLLNAGPPVGFGPVRGTLSATARYAESPPGLGGDLDSSITRDCRSITQDCRSITWDGARSPRNAGVQPRAGVRAFVRQGGGCDDVTESLRAPENAA